LAPGKGKVLKMIAIDSVENGFNGHYLVDRFNKKLPFRRRMYFQRILCMV
jgi:hypothetical protein